MFCKNILSLIFFCLLHTPPANYSITSHYTLRTNNFCKAKEMATNPVCLLFCYCYLLLASEVSGITPVTYPAKTSSECSLSDPLEDEQFMEALRQIQQQLGTPGCNPPMNTSCQEILHCFPSAPSGYYQIHAPNGSAVQVYCDMEGINCGGEGGWMRVAYVNMTEPNTTCPQGLTQSDFAKLTLCGRINGGYDVTTPRGGGCQGTVFSTFGLVYSRVCGQLRGYQNGTPDAFRSYNLNTSSSINDVYVDGVSITYGSTPHKHIWTYATGTTLNYVNFTCPCNDNGVQQVPPYVGSDYYCETSAHVYTCCAGIFHFYPNDTLWDGQNCVGEEAPCCTHPNMPWFLKTLSETTTEDIELRVCGDHPADDEDTPLQVIELFVYWTVSAHFHIWAVWLTVCEHYYLTTIWL